MNKTSKIASNKRVVVLLIGLLLTTTTCTKVSKMPVVNEVTYQDGVIAAEWAYSGLDFLSEKDSSKSLHSGFNYYSKSTNSNYGFNAGLSLISTYMATGDDKFLAKAKNTAHFLEKILPATGLVPEYRIKGDFIEEKSKTAPGSNGQSCTIQLVAYLAREDSSFKPLLHKLSDGLLKYGVNPSNNLAWFNLYTSTGIPVKDPSFEYESQLGSASASVAEALLAAYETDLSKIQYRNAALNILKSIWECRDTQTNLIPETWDIVKDIPGKSLYPYGDFRYDDMGGAYIRALTLAYNITKDEDILQILRDYIPALVSGIWDKHIQEGAFRYMTTTKGKVSVRSLEIMHGAFITALLESLDLLNPIRRYLVYRKIKKDIDHIFLTGFVIKNGMVPHQVNQDGAYFNNQSDSQLGYAVLQYPLGFELLSQVSGKSEYRQCCNTIMKTLLQRHKIGDNITSPQGYVNIVETQPPYGLELNYSTPSWMYQAFYIPAYIFYSSIHPSEDVSIDWQHGNAPGIFGLCSNMPYWDMKKVRVKDHQLWLSAVSGAGNINLTDMGWGNIKSASIDGKKYADLNGAVIQTQKGTHSYYISWK